MSDKSTYGQWSFNGGELSPRIQTRVDLEVSRIALATMLGWLPLLQGPALAAPGTYFVAEAAGPSRLFPFEYNPTQGYVIEASDSKFRFYTNNGRIESPPGTAYEVAHDYSFADLADLDYVQSADVVYFAGADQQQKKLSRLTATTFDFDDLELRNGPIETGNSDETVTVTVSGTLTVGGTVTVTASSAIFASGDVGSLFEIEVKDFNDIKSWEPGMDNIPNGTKLQWGGRVYQITAVSDFTGSVPPEHDEGEEWDGIGQGQDAGKHGPYGCKLLYLYNRFGMVRITGYTSPTAVTAEVVKRLADSVATTATWKWAFGAFSDTRGWPDTVGLWNDCLVFTKGNKGYTSVIGEFDNFAHRDSSGDFQRDLAGQFTLPTHATVNWQAADRYLLLGTDTAEFTVERVQVQTGTPGPPVFEIRLQSSNGSKKTKPIQADGRMLFVQKAGRKLRELGYAIQQDRYVAPDMTRLADHIGIPGYSELAWQAEPERLARAVRGDGTLAAMTYDPEQQVMGWCRRELGGGLLAKSACRITDPDGRRDQIWLAVDASAIAGAGTYWVLREAKSWEIGDDQQDAMLVDAGLSYDGSGATVFSGLDHLEGETVQILADGKVHPERTVTGGEVTLGYAADKVHVGLGFTAEFETMLPEVGQSEGTAQGKLKRVVGVDLHVVETQGIRISVQGCETIPVETRTAADPMDEAVPLYTGIISIPTIGTYERLGRIKVERYQPTPATIVAIVPRVIVGES